MKSLHWNLFYILFFLLGANSVQAALLAQVDYNLTEGFIEIEPTVAIKNGDTVFVGRKSSCCNLLDLFRSEKEIPPEDHYFFLNGDPDKLSILYVQLVCLNGSLQSTTSSFKSFDVFKAKVALNGKFYSGHEVSYYVLKSQLPHMVDILSDIYWDKYGEAFVVPTSLQGSSRFSSSYNTSEGMGFSNFVNLACSDDFKRVFEKNRVLSGKFEDQIFGSKFDGKKLKIFWDVDSWRDETQRSYNLLMERYRALYKKTKLD